MNRCSFCEWIPILPRPIWPLAGQCQLGQNVVLGSMTLLLAVRGNIATRSMSGPPFALQLHHTTVWCGATGVGTCGENHGISDARRIRPVPRHRTGAPGVPWSELPCSHGYYHAPECPSRCPITGGLCCLSAAEAHYKSRLVALCAADVRPS